MKLSVALRRLKGMTAWDSEPALTEPELLALLDDARRPDADGNPIENVVEWEPDTSFVEGDQIVADGWTYVCVHEGNTGPVEPAWGASVEDGDVVWERRDPCAWTPTYDLYAAAAEGWMLKAGKAASMISFTADGARFDRDQYLANCQTMADHYRSRIITTITVRPRRRRTRRAQRA